jgi:hypothetical protein
MAAGEGLITGCFNPEFRLFRFEESGQPGRRIEEVDLNPFRKPTAQVRVAIFQGVTILLQLIPGNLPVTVIVQRW